MCLSMVLHLVNVVAASITCLVLGGVVLVVLGLVLYTVDMWDSCVEWMGLA